MFFMFPNHLVTLKILDKNQIFNHFPPQSYEPLKYIPSCMVAIQEGTSSAIIWYRKGANRTTGWPGREHERWLLYQDTNTIV